MPLSPEQEQAGSSEELAARARCQQRGSNGVGAGPRLQLPGGAAAAQRGLSRRRAVTLALARGPFRRLQTSKELERATRRRRGAALSRATPRALAARGRRGRRGGGGPPPATGASHGPQTASRRSVLLWAEPVSFSVFVLHEPAARVGAGTRSREPRSIPRAPRAHSLSTAAQAREDRAPLRLPGSSYPPAPIPDLGGASLTLSPVREARRRRPTLRSSSHRAPLQKLPALPEAAAIGAQERTPPPPRQSPEVSGRAG